jgi:integrase
MHNESNKSWNHRRSDIVSMIRYCEKKNLLQPGALNCGAIERRKVGPGSRATCLVEELQRLLDHAEYLQDQLCIALQAQAGLRTAEVERFRLCFVDWEEQMIRLPGVYKGLRLTKTNQARYIPIPQPLYDLLLRLKAQGYPETDLVMRVKNWTNRLRTIAEAAKVKIPYNGLRHGFGSHRRQLTKSVDQTAEDMGTSSWYVKNHYSLPQLSRVSEAWFAAKAPLLP